MSLLDDPRVFNLVQMLGGWSLTVAPKLRGALVEALGQEVLDIGAGTGNLASLLPPNTSYVAIDNDPVRVRYLERRIPTASCRLGSATDTGLEDGAVGWTVCVGLAHHLADEDLPRLIAEMARVTRERLVFCDPLWPGRPLLGGVLWRYDRGSHPRTEETLLTALRRHFVIDRVDHIQSLQKFLLCVAHPAHAERRSPIFVAQADDSDREV
jgi:SAM-dependent methyltransferase